MYNEIVKVTNNAQIMSEKEITDELINIVKDQAGGSLFLKFWLAQGVINETQFSIAYMWYNLLSEKKQDLYIEVIKERGKKSIEDVMHYFLQSGIEINNSTI